ncbi:MAG: protein jag [Clostridia bacterium]|nr:protein jag [Clostridia bacterium]
MGYYYGKSVDSAIEEGLKDLGVSKEQVEITVIEEAQKGLLGLGGKKAKVKIEVKVEDSKRASDFLDGLFEKLNVVATTEIKEDGDRIELNIVSTSSSYLIGHRGEMLDALQTLAGAVANIGNDEYKRVVVDCENYRSKRENTLIDLANKLASKAVKTGRKVTLEPMNPFERRVIHSALSENDEVTTESQGNEPNRFVVIIPKNLKTYSKDGFNRKNNKFDRKDKREPKEEMIRGEKKPLGFGTFLGNSQK